MLMNEAEPAAGGPTNSEFMRLLLQAAPRGTYGWVCNFIGAPRAGADWGGRPYQGGGQLEQEIDTWHPYNTYFSVGALQGVDSDGVQARKKALFNRLLALVVDDADLNELLGRPSYVLQTSPGKHQVGIFLERDDPDCANLALVDALMRVLFERRLIGGDPSGNNGVRYTRLPVGSNLKQRESGPFRHAMVVWNPEQRMTLADAAAVVGVDIDELRERAAASQAASAGMQLGPAGMGQDERLEVAVGNVMRGIGLHESLNQIAASMVATGMPGGAVVNLMRALMTNSLAARDDRWQDRYADIPRSVRTAEEKFRRPPPLEMPAAADVETTPEQAKPSILIKASALLAGGVKAIKWLIHGYLEAGAMSMLFGPPGSLKSFIAVDQACCTATGTPWHGNEVRQGPVVIVVGEGKAGMARRMAAWEEQHGVKIGEAPLYITEKAVPFLDAEAAMVFVEAVDEICRGLNRPPVLVVIDTLARNFGVGDENSAKDANAFIQVIDEHIRLRYTFGDSECHVIIVHHSGHIKGRERGSTAFPGAMDQRYEVQRFGDEVEYVNRKMKDGEEPPSIRFTFVKGIYLGEVDGNVIDGAALKRAGSVLDVVAVKGKKGEVTVGKFLELMVAEKVPSVREIAELLGISKSGVATAQAKCLAMGLLAKPEGHNTSYLLTDEGRLALSKTGYMALGGRIAQDEEDGDE